MSREAMWESAGRTRLSGGFTLDDVARLYRGERPGSQPQCPMCGSAMHQVPGCCPAGRVTLLHCDSCGRGLVLSRPLGGLPS